MLLEGVHFQGQLSVDRNYFRVQFESTVKLYLVSYSFTYLMKHQFKNMLLICGQFYEDNCLAKSLKSSVHHLFLTYENLFKKAIPSFTVHARSCTETTHGPKKIMNMGTCI